jgi:hypothetical protein
MSATAPRATARAPPRSSNCDAQRAAPRAEAWAPRSSTCDKQRAAPRATAWAATKYLRRTASGAAGNVLGTTKNNLLGATEISLGTTAKYLRRTTSAAAGNGLGTTAKYLRGAASIGLGTKIKYLRLLLIKFRIMRSRIILYRTISYYIEFNSI